MENLDDSLKWFKSIPMWLRVVVVILVSALVVIFSATSCGASRSTVRVYNRADSTTTTISVSNGDGGSTTVNVEPKINVDSTKIFSSNGN